MTPRRRFAAEPATAHPADVDAARVAQGLIDNLPAHIDSAARAAHAQALAATGDPDEAAGAARAVVREWLFSGGLQDLDG